jgi:hypothetical protein
MFVGFSHQHNVTLFVDMQNHIITELLITNPDRFFPNFD